MILSLFRKDPSQEVAAVLYRAAAAQARETAFYCDYGVADTVEGRYEMLILHVWIILKRLKSASNHKSVSQGVIDSLFANIDDSLREMGVGDLSVGRKARAMAEAFYGRVRAYDAAIESDNEVLFQNALSRNVYGASTAPGAPRLATYFRTTQKMLITQSDGRLLSGIVLFPKPGAGSGAVA